MKRHPLKPLQTYDRYLIWDTEAERIKDQVILPLGAAAPAPGDKEEVHYVGTVQTDAAGELIEEGAFKLERP